ncbi:MAG: hypothetical protein M1840_009064 [Geoglossum simile]|nr:MAG: hypothetical protein M1840_009064 [Geoglossum simile]
MFALDDTQKDIIRTYPVDGGLDRFYKSYFEFVSKSSSNPSFNDIASSAITDRGPQRLIKTLLNALQGLDAADELPSYNRSSRKSLFDDLYILLGRFPQQLNIEAVGILLEHVVEHPDDEESIWSAVYGLFHEDRVPPTIPPQMKNFSPTSREHFLRDIYKDWNRDFFNDALIGLQQQMRGCINGAPEYYAKTLVFVQSSGVGKSRLADSFGRICPMISFVLRGEGDGYPPPDHQVRNFMCQAVPNMVRKVATVSPLKKGGPGAREFSERRLASIWNHCLAFAILEASINSCESRVLSLIPACSDSIVNDWVMEQNRAEISLEDLALLIYDEMKLVSNTADPRSLRRISFCDKVVEEADQIALRLAKDEEWRHLFNDERDSAFRAAIENSGHMKALHLVIENLMGNLGKRWRKDRDDNYLLTFVFDEASSLFYTNGSSGSDSGRYIALNRIISCLRKFPVWFFFLSTESKVEKILPPGAPRPADEDYRPTSANKNSARMAFGPGLSEKLRVLPPFVAFPLDVEDRRNMRDPVNRKAELVKSMVEFSEPKHMAMFGRCLWGIYSIADQMYDVAKLKVIGGSDVYNPNNNHHAFAVLSFRLALDPCLESTISLPLLRTAVGSFMRIVISMDQRTGFLHTTTPSEPILAYAAMRHLCSRAGNWLLSIDTFSRELLQQGLIEKGLKGELFSRLLLILAHDSLRGALDLETMPTFTVKDLLLALYASDHHISIQKIDTEILQAQMNFTHFATTDQDLLPGDPTLSLCHDLLRRCAALQLSHGNPAFDQLIPIYFGQDKEPFDRSKCGVIVIQNKNKGAATTPDYVFGEQFSKVSPSATRQAGKANNQTSIRQKVQYAFREMDCPILFLLFDLGTEPGNSPPVQVSCSTDSSHPPVWAIHSRGHTEAVFGCLETMGVESVVETFFAASVVEKRGIYHEIARRNLVFNYMTQSSRYASPKADGSEYVEDLDGWRQDSNNDGKDIEETQDSREDTPMIDA